MLFFYAETGLTASTNRVNDDCDNWLDLDASVDDLIDEPFEVETADCKASSDTYEVLGNGAKEGGVGFRLIFFISAFICLRCS